MIFVITLFTAGSVIGGRLLFGRWFNHASLYGVVWGFSLLLFELRLIQYYTLEPETWMLILSAWAAFLFGSATIPFARWASGAGLGTSSAAKASVTSSAFSSAEERAFRIALWVLGTIALLVALQHWSIVAKKFGGVSNVLLLGNFLYSSRVAEGLPGTIPYLASLALTATFLAGVYTAKIGRIKLVALYPMVVVIMLETASMGRAKIIMAGILFASGYALYKDRTDLSRRAVRRGRMKRIVALLTAVLVLVAGLEFIRSARRPNEDLTASTRTLQTLRGASFITPSIYLYLTVHHGVFNQYLKHDDERYPFGSNTLAPAYRILTKLGFDTAIPAYPRMYKTPVYSNSGTYLRELHADFGIAGVLLAPYLLGMVVSITWFRLRDRKSYADLAIAAFLFVFVGMSLFYFASRSGDLLIAFAVAWVGGKLLDRWQAGLLNTVVLSTGNAAPALP